MSRASSRRGARAAPRSVEAAQFAPPDYRRRRQALYDSLKLTFVQVRHPMQPVSLILNILWILIGGAWMAFGWLVASVIMAVTIIGLPWARAAFNIAIYTLLPFGSRAVSRDEVTGMSDIGTGALGVIGNIIWLVLAGWWLALGHLLTAVLFAITIIGITSALANGKVAGDAAWP